MLEKNALSLSGFWNYIGARERRTMLRLRASRILGSVVDLVCPPECVWCAAPSVPQQEFCSACRDKMVNEYHRCRVCASPIPPVVPNHDCHRCREAGWRFDRVITLGPYRNDLKTAVIKMKRPSEFALRKAISRLMAEELQRPEVEVRSRERAGESHTSEEKLATTNERRMIVPVPNYWSHRILGAADSAGGLAGTVGQLTGISVITGKVRRIRRTAKQGMLPWSERSENVRGAFEIPEADAFSGGHVILVDDVLTSGATASELSSRLKKAGAQSVTVLVAARGTGAKEIVPSKSN